MTPFILGIDDSVPGSAYLPTDRLCDLVGHNTGNLAFVHAISNTLGGGLNSVSWYAKPEAIEAAGELGVMPCANQLGPHDDLGSLAAVLRQVERPLVAVGLGAQGPAHYRVLPEVPQGTLDWVRAIADRAPGDGPNIGVRGPFTKAVLDRLGLGERVEVLGCPTLFLNPDPTLGAKIAAKADRPFDRVAVASGHQEWLDLSRLEASLTRIMAATDGAYIVQSPEIMVALGRGEAGMISDLSLTACRDYAAPELTLEEFRRWSRRYARAFFDISSWMEYLRSFDFVVGLRIHGVMLGLQAGVPSLCIAHDSRTRELCETMKVPFVLSKDVSTGMTRDDLKARFQFDAAEFDANRREIGDRFAAFLRRNGLRPHGLPGGEASPPPPHSS